MQESIRKRIGENRLLYQLTVIVDERIIRTSTQLQEAGVKPRTEYQVVASTNESFVIEVEGGRLAQVFPRYLTVVSKKELPL